MTRQRPAFLSCLVTCASKTHSWINRDVFFNDFFDLSSEDALRSEVEIVDKKILPILDKRIKI